MTGKLEAVARRLGYRAVLAWLAFAGSLAAAEPTDKTAVTAQVKADVAALVKILAESGEAVRLTVQQATKAGALCTVSRQAEAPSAVQELVTKYGGGGKVAPSWEKDDASIFVAGWDAYDGEKRDGLIYPCGKHRYISVVGAERTVQRFALSPDEAARLVFEDRGIKLPAEIAAASMKSADESRAEARLTHTIMQGAIDGSIQVVRLTAGGSAALMYSGSKPRGDVWIVDTPELVASKWAGTLYPCGQYTYANSGRTVARYATTLKAAMEALRKDREQGVALPTQR